MQSPSPALSVLCVRDGRCAAGPEASAGVREGGGLTTGLTTRGSPLGISELRPPRLQQGLDAVVDEEEAANIAASLGGGGGCGVGRGRGRGPSLPPPSSSHVLGRARNVEG